MYKCDQPESSTEHAGNKQTRKTRDVDDRHDEERKNLKDDTKKMKSIYKQTCAYMYMYILVYMSKREDTVT